MNNANDPNFLYKAPRAISPGCSECAQERLVVQAKLHPDMLFSAAFDTWIQRRTIDEIKGLATKVRFIKVRTRKDYVGYARALERFKAFRVKPIGALAPDDLMSYQNARALNAPSPEGEWWCHKGQKPQGPHRTLEGAQAWAEKQGGGYEIKQTLWAQPCGANLLRKEVALMVRILREAGLWGDSEEEVLLRVRAEESDVVHAMTLQEQHRFLHVASSKLEFRTVYQYAIVGLQTTCSTNELRALRLCDILLHDRIIQIPPAGAKNVHRFRAIPIVTDDCMWALEGLLERARTLGSTLSSHYLFPLRVSPGKWNPAKPMSDSGLKKQWEAVRVAARMPHLRMYDLRHTGITRMAEAGVPLAVAMTFAGHMTKQMQQRYTAICMAAQRGWGASVWGDGATQGGVPRKPVMAERNAWNQGRHWAGM